MLKRTILAAIVGTTSCAGPILVAPILAGTEHAAVAVGFAPKASTSGYVPSTSVTVSGEHRAGGLIVVDFSPGSFSPGEVVVIEVTGISGFVHTERLVAGADGALRFEFRVPADGVGSYDVVATGVSSGSIGTARIDLIPADTGAPASGALPSTGLHDPLLITWVAGGATVLAGAMVATGVQRRKQQARRYAMRRFSGPRWPSFE